MLIIDIGVADIIIDVLVKFRIVAMPDKFTLVLVILTFDVGSRIQGVTTRRRGLIP